MLEYIRDYRPSQGCLPTTMILLQVYLELMLRKYDIAKRCEKQIKGYNAEKNR